MKDKLGIFVERLYRIGIKIKLISNYPWIYIDEINGHTVVEKYCGNHGFTVAFPPIKSDQELIFTDFNEIFRLIRKYCNKSKKSDT